MSLFSKILILIIITSSVYAETAVLSKSEFTEAFFKRVTEELKEADITKISTLHIKIENLDKNTLNIYLDNAYDVYLSKERSIEDIFFDQINVIKSQTAALESSDVNSILPVIKPKSYIEAAKAQLKESGYTKDELPFYIEQLNEDIYVLYVFDTPESMRFMSPDERADLDTKSVRNTATQNLDAYYIEVGATIEELDTNGKGKVFLFTADENYEASAILSPSLWRKDLIDVEGDYVAFIPARNVALIAGSDDKEGLNFASNLARQAYSELAYSISPYVYRKKGDN